MTDAKARLLQMIADEPHMGGGGLLKAVGKAQKVAKAKKAAEKVAKTVERVAAPQDEALRLAQKRAALPIAQGGLGLPANNTPAQRAAAMGINTNAYHGTKQNITGAFKPGYDDNLAFVTHDPEFANKWIGKGKIQKRAGPEGEAELKSAEDLYRALKEKHMDYESLNTNDPNFHAEYDKRDSAFKEAFAKDIGLYPDKTHSTVYPLMVQANKRFDPETDMDVMAEFFEKNNTPKQLQELYKGGNYLIYETKPVVDYLKSKGYDSMRLRESTGDDYPTTAVFDPESVRSRFAAFDPFRRNAATAAAMGVAAPDLLADEKKAAGGAVHMAGGGKPKPTAEELAAMRAKQFNVKNQIMLGNPNQFNKDRANQLYPKKETMNPIVKAAKDKLDQFNAFIDRGVPVKELVGGLTGAIPFVGPKLREDLESATVDFPLGFERLPGNEQVATGNIETAPAKVFDILDSLKMSDLTGGTGASSVLNSVGKGYMPDPLDLLDAASAAALGYGAIKGGLKAGVKGAGALSNLAKSDTGYKLAQKALEFTPAAQPMNVVKPEGGNWLSGNTEKGLKYLKRGNYDIPQNIRDDLDIEDLTPQELAINKWVDSNLANYVKKQMATPSDPVRKLAEEGITHKADLGDLYLPLDRATQGRVAAGFPAEGLGKSHLAQQWELLTDPKILGRYAKEITAKRVLDENPWISKLDPDTPVYGGLSEVSARNLGFDHIVDVLNQDLAAGRIRPEQLNKISMEQAVRRTYEYDQEMAKKMRETQAKVTEGMPVYKEYPEGYKWIELAQPKNMKLPEGYSVKPDPIRNQKTGAVDNNSYRLVDNEGKLVGWGRTEDEAVSAGLGEKVLKDALKYEGNKMGHCVGGYCPDVIEGKSRIFSLRDAKGEPHVTIETTPGDLLVTFNKLSQDEQAAVRKVAGTWASDEELFDAMRQVVPEKTYAPDRIVQIKGKQNRAPNKDYLPFVQDFVKGGTWEEVGDLRNTGLRDLKNTPKVEEYLKSKNADVPRYLTEDEYKGYEGDFLMDELGKVAENDPLTQRLLNEQPRMAEGGAVSDAKQRLLNMIAEEPHMAGGGVLKAVAKAQKTAKKAKMYSAVDKALEASKRGAGTGMEFANELAKTSGIKKAELVDRGIMVPSKNGPVLNPALTQLPKMSKQEFVSHLNEKYKPPGVRKISITDPKLTDEVIDKKAMQMMADDVNDYVDRHGDADYDDVFDSRYNNDYDQYFERAKEALSEDVGTKYSQYKLPGGENYRENLYQYENPTGKAFLQSHFDEPNVMYHMRQTDRITPTYTSAQIDEIGQRMADAMSTKVENLASGAPILMMQKGVISPVEAAQFSHAKGFQNMDIDMSPAQKRALHIEEIQSDWHQKGRDQGYRGMFDRTPEQVERELTVLHDKRSRLIDEAAALPDSEMPKFLAMQEEIKRLGEQASQVSTEWNELLRSNALPDAPFKKNWHEHALKQALMDAAEGDYNQLLITSGAEQAKRYDLSKQISKVRYFDEPNSDSGLLHAYDLEGNNVLSERIPKEKLPDYIGKDAAEKLLSQTAKENERTGFPSQERTLSGLDLQVGGEGMAGFYDKMVPNYLNDIGKKYGVRVGERAIEGDVPYSKTTPTLADVQRLAQEMYGVSDIQAISALPLEQRNAINQAFADKVRAEHTTKLHSFDITPEMREDILNNGLPMYQRGGEVHMGIGGVPGKAKKIAKAAEAAKKAAEMAAKAAKAAEVASYLPGVHYADPLLPPNMRLSEALGNAGAEGKTLNFTETDRSRVFGPNRGGAGFAGLQHYSLPHKEANTVWGFGSKGITEKKINQNDPENTIWTTYAGSPTQHKSNTVVVKDALGQLQAADKSGLVNPKQIEFINDRIRSALSKNGKPLFPKDFDITDPKAFDFATTFDRRAAISDALMGIGVKKPMISKEFKAANPGVKWQDAANIEAILRRETDPAMVGASTFDVGPNLFVMDNGIIHRPDLNEAFPYQVTGTDLGMRYELAPFRDAAPDWIKARGIKPNEPINAWAMSRAAPSQFVSDKYLTGLQKKGRKEGGLAYTKKVKRHGNTVSN